MIKKKVLLSGLTTFKIGGPANYYTEISEPGTIPEVSRFAKKENLPIFVLGGGSDILVGDKGFPGIVVKFTANNIKVDPSGGEYIVTSEAGAIWDDLVKHTVNLGLSGIECMSYIPGTVGAAPIQNIGAYGQELKDTFHTLKAYNWNTEKYEIFEADDCEFGYRESIFKKPSHWQKYLITEVSLKLGKKGKLDIKYDSLKDRLSEKGVIEPTLKEIRETVIEIRKSKFENYQEFPNAGSFFKNPVIKETELKNLLLKYPEMPYYDNNDGTYKLFAGWLIETAGWKGKKMGNAQVSPRHSLILLNPVKKAKAKEIQNLADSIIKDIKVRFDIELVREVQYIGN